MPVVHLTKREVAHATPSPTEYTLWDDATPGFGLRVRPSGHRSYVLKCRPAGGRDDFQRKVTIGDVGALTLDEARRIAVQLKGQVAAGVDPAQPRVGRRASSKAKREALTVAQLGVDYLDDVRARRKQSTAHEYGRLWNAHVVPAFGTAKVAEVTTAQVGKLHRSLRSTPYGANRVLALLGSFFTFAERQGERAQHSNPTATVDAFPEQQRERVLSQIEEVRLWKATELAITIGLPPAPRRRRPRKSGKTARNRPRSADGPVRANPVAIAAIRFLFLTGWREREALNLRWAEVDLANRRVVLTNTKTGRSARIISARACAVISEIARVEASPYVFAGKVPGQPLTEISRVWYAVRHAAQLDHDGDVVRLHDLRHNFASKMAGGGASLLMIGKALGHRDNKSTMRYAHLVDDSMREAIDRASTAIARDDAGNAPASGGDRKLSLAL